MGPCRNRRDFLRVAGASLLTTLAPSSRAVRAAQAGPAGAAPSLPVSIARCTGYDREALYRQLQAMMDQLGGISQLVSGKTVAVKVNLTGSMKEDALGLPAWRTYHVHPDLVVATAALLDRAGAKRIRFLECTYQGDPFETYLKAGGWDLNALGALKAKVEYEDTRNLGRGAKYHEVKVPWGGSLFPAYHLNHSYVDCDVYVSLAKLKNHGVAGVTLGIKNNFGITPPALYSHHEPNEQAMSARVAVFHSGEQRPADGLPQELDPASPRRPTYRVPRHTVDALGIRPIDLTIIDGIETVSGGEGPWLPSLKVQRPGLLLAGRNPVCTDAVATAVMGYDPTAAPGSGVFPGDNHLAMAAALGLGTNDPANIEARGLSIKEALHPFGWLPAERNG
ncbi:hypothetical protein OJF2_71350 [Aquisphaera giovannonii]|uniref:DUF362 domain-containing protein n=1 Tax=Aquisphaera giovannonii TaxID=406548 RepID=A0A5B9WD79_9BACT|nr:DUF362 domain-containing protein [Aquisphaera giovannonii]QEH38532.1 hypothetical protein OJF2_71350 [Aquisphaera giovannonii]